MDKAKSPRGRTVSVHLGFKVEGGGGGAGVKLAHRGEVDCAPAAERVVPEGRWGGGSGIGRGGQRGRRAAEEVDHGDRRSGGAGDGRAEVDHDVAGFDGVDAAADSVSPMGRNF